MLLMNIIQGLMRLLDLVEPILMPENRATMIAPEREMAHPSFTSQALQYVERRSRPEILHLAFVIEDIHYP